VETVKSPNGKSRSYEENKLFILALRATLRRQIEAIQENRLSPLKLSWTLIEEEVARDFHVGREYISKVRCTLIEDGDVTVFGLLEEPGGVAPGCSHNKQTKIPAHVLISMASYIDEMHSKGASVTNRRLQNRFFAATKSIPLCDGISGTIGTLVVDGDYVEDELCFLLMLL
jgi:hypothetical protein